VDVVSCGNAITSEYIVAVGLGRDEYTLGVLSNNDMVIEKGVLRGFYYNKTYSSGLSIKISPKEFNHYTIYHVEGVDIKDLWISMTMVVTRLILLLTLFLGISTVYPL
jgi:hypothetical protein